MRLHRQLRVVVQHWLFMTVLTTIAAASIISVAAQPTDKMPDAAEFDAFIAKQEKAMDAAQKRLLAAIKKRDATVRRARGLGVDTIRKTREAIEQDRQELVANCTLPNSDELLEDVVLCLKYYQDIAQRIEAFRARLANRAVRVENPADLDKLAALEARLSDVLLGREHFKAGSTWRGERHSNTGAFELRLTIDNVTGNNFSGELHQKGNYGRGALMVVKGQVQGNRIEFQTTQMNRGKNRSFSFQGYLLSDRIITNMEGISAKGEPVLGWTSLWSGGKSRRRG